MRSKRKDHIQQAIDLHFATKSRLRSRRRFALLPLVDDAIAVLKAYQKEVAR